MKVSKDEIAKIIKDNIKFTEHDGQCCVSIRQAASQIMELLEAEPIEEVEWEKGFDNLYPSGGWLKGDVENFIRHEVIEKICKELEEYAVEFPGTGCMVAPLGDLRAVIKRWL